MILVGKGVLRLCRDVIGVFYSPSQEEEENDDDDSSI